MVVRRGPEAAGVTLLELLVAISMSAVVVLLALSLFRDAGFASRLTGGRSDAAFAAQAAFGSLADNLMQGRGILRLAPGEAELLNRRNRRLAYVWRDSTLTVNGKTYPFALESLIIAPSGPRRPAWKPFSGETPWDLDSLDADRDGVLGFDELDRDRDGALDSRECRYVAAVRVTLAVRFRDAPLLLTCVVHPRNRASDTSASARDISGFPSGIPDP